MATTTITVVSLTGREIMTEETLAAYCGHGGGGQYIIDLFYFAPENKHKELTLPINVDLHLEKYDGMMPDFWKILAFVPEGTDWIFLEDDCTPCNSALAKMVETDVPEDIGLLSFFDLRNEWPRPGIWRNILWDDEAKGVRRHLYGSQAVKIPARVLPALKAFGREQRKFSANWDTWMGLAMDELGLAVAHYAPSLVQHLGAVSVAYPGTSHTRPVALNYPGDDFHAFGASDDPIKPGKWKSSAWDFTTDPNWCTMHKRMHPGGNKCPRIGQPRKANRLVEKKLPPQNMQEAWQHGFKACCGKTPPGFGPK